MRILPKILLLLAVFMYSSISFAGSISIPGPALNQFAENDETVVSIGLRLEFSDVVKPSIVGAVRRTETDTDNDVTGVMADIAIPLSPEGFSPGVFRVMGIFGDTDVQGLAGLGFDFRNNQGLVGLGAQTDFVDGGVNLGFDGSVTPYVGVSTYDGPPSRTAVRRGLRRVRSMFD